MHDTRMLAALRDWTNRNLVDLAREMRWSYLPPLMVYMAAGISGLTAIVESFFVKDHLGLSAAFLASLAFWIVVPWSLKMVFGHLIDLLWRWKGMLVFMGAALVAASLMIMAGLIAQRTLLVAFMPVDAWFVSSQILAQVGYVLQDAVADAMTVEAVPRLDEHGQEIDAERRQRMHTTMQTLGRIAVISGTLLVSAINIYLFSGANELSPQDKVAVYRDIYLMALVIPAISVIGVIVASALRTRDTRRLRAQGVNEATLVEKLHGPRSTTSPNWWILGGGAAFMIFTVTIGLLDLRYGQEIIFVGSMAIIAFLIARLTRELDPSARTTLVGTAVVIFVFRAVPLPGPALTWWMIDELGFDEKFLSVLSLTAGLLTLAALFLLRRFVARNSITRVVAILTVLGAVLALPNVGMYYGLHQWTSSLTGGVVDARFIAITNTALESPLVQIAAIPMLAWIARCAPEQLKATYFAVMASFTNLALSCSQLMTKYLNQIFVVARQVRDPATGAVITAADYSQLGALLIACLLIAMAFPLLAILFAKISRFKSA